MKRWISVKIVKVQLTQRQYHLKCVCPFCFVDIEVMYIVVEMTEKTKCLAHELVMKKD